MADQGAKAEARLWDEREEASAAVDILNVREAAMKTQRAAVERAEAAYGIRAELEAEERLVKARADEEAQRAAADSALKALKALEGEQLQREKEASALGEKAALLERALGEAEGRAQAWERYEKARRVLTEAQAAVAAADTRLESAKVSESALASGIAELEGQALDGAAFAAERAAAQATAEAAADTLARCRQRDRLDAELSSCKADKASAEAALASAAEALAQAEGRLSLLRDEEERYVAQRLAAQLVAGAPCPVCGSMEHPAPAHLSAQAADSAGLSDTSGGTRKVVEAGLKALLQEESKARARLESLCAREDSLNVSLAEQSALPQSPQAEADLSAARAALDILNRRESENLNLLKTIADARKELEASRLARTGMAAEAAKAAATLAAAGASVDEAAKAAGEGDPRPGLLVLGEELSGLRIRLPLAQADLEAYRHDCAVAERKRADADERLRGLVQEESNAKTLALAALEAAGFHDKPAWAHAFMDKAELRRVKEDIAAYDAACVAAGARLEAAQRAYAASASLGSPRGERPNLELFEDELERAAASYEAARLAADEASARAREAGGYLTELKKTRAKRAELGSRLESLVALARLLNGETAGRRLSFKNYALASYFSLVSKSASLRLRDMSDGRYDLRVAEGKASGQGRVGLELEVLDSYTGRARPAASLSGGEKFLCAISLAFGLSDVIVRSAGGAALDSIFIDEGFGSLDEDALDRAMAALDRVRGDRMIGIVSHVPELRSRIPSRVEVLKTRTGSSLELFGGA
ncbi:MAG TPA: hypothetical protein DCG47_09075 [Spirochaetaceae bacterium]|nr:hypothetical protein [Spirochaetaceae bacterium]